MPVACGRNSYQSSSPPTVKGGVVTRPDRSWAGRRIADALQLGRIEPRVVVLERIGVEDYDPAVAVRAGPARHRIHRRDVHPLDVFIDDRIQDANGDGAAVTVGGLSPAASGRRCRRR